MMHLPKHHQSDICSGGGICPPREAFGFGALETSSKPMNSSAGVQEGPFERHKVSGAKAQHFRKVQKAGAPQDQSHVEDREDLYWLLRPTMAFGDCDDRNANNLVRTLHQNCPIESGLWAIVRDCRPRPDCTSDDCGPGRRTMRFPVGPEVRGLSHRWARIEFSAIAIAATAERIGRSARAVPRQV
jgi:hypothetical protein